MNMILRDLQFPVREATISSYILNPEWVKKYGKNENAGLCWEVVVQTEEQLIDEDEEFSVDARFTCGEFSLPIRRWVELEGKTVHSNSVKSVSNAPVAVSYFWTHEAIPYSTLKFVKRTGNKFLIHWEGICHPMWDEPYKKDVPFLIETEAAFKEISLHASAKDTDATTLERLSKYIDTDDFIQQPMKEIIHQIPVENHFGIISPLLRRIFGYPETTQSISRYSIFEPRL